MDTYENQVLNLTGSLPEPSWPNLFRLINFLKGKGFKLIPSNPVGKDSDWCRDIPPESIYYLPAVQMIAYQLMELSAQKRFQPDRPVSGAEALSSRPSR